MSELTYRQTMNRVGLAFFAFMVMAQVGAAIVAAVCVMIVPTLYQQQWFMVLCGTLPIYLFGLPVLAAILLSVPTTQKAPQKQHQGIGWYLMLIPLAYTAMYAGNLLGMGVNKLLSLLLHADMTSPLDMILGDSLGVVSIVMAVIVGPIMEEIMFRWLLYRKLSRWGDKVFVITSGILFGLFHGNVEQLFYAALLGFVLAYAYARTGRLWVPIALHILFNLAGSVVAMAATQSETGTIAYSAATIALAVAGVVWLVVRFKHITFLPGVAQPPRHAGWQAFFTLGMLLAVSLALVLIATVALMPVLQNFLSSVGGGVDTLENALGEIGNL